MSGRGLHVAPWEKVKPIKDNFSPHRKKLEELIFGFNLKIGTWD